MIYGVLVIFIGCLWFSFSYWRRLKEDYINNQIYTSIIIILVLVALFYFLSDKYISQYSYWAGMSGLFLGVSLSSKKYRLRFYETLEASIVSAFPFLSGIYLIDTIKHSSLFSLGAFVITFLFLFIYNYINNRYKNFGWYKSGRVGFAGLTTLGIYFILRGVIAIVFPFMISFSGGYETIISGVVSFLLFLAVFDLSRK